MSALAQPTRLEVFTILERAGAAGMTSGELARRTGAAANTMSAHLAILNRAELVASERSGRKILYRWVPETVSSLIGFLGALEPGSSGRSG